MEEKIKRPPSVFITQIALLLLSLSVFVNAAYNAFVLKDELFSIGMIIVTLMMLALAAVPIVAFWGLVNQKRYGRNVALLFFAFTWLVWFGQLYRVVVLVVYENIDVDDRQLLMSNIVLGAILLCLLLGLIVMLAFSKTITAWLSSAK